MKSFSHHGAGRITLLVAGLIASIGSAAGAQEIELNLRSKLESLTTGILNPFASPSGMAADGSLPSPIRPSVGDPFAALQSRIFDADSQLAGQSQNSATNYPITGTSARIHFSVTTQNGTFSHAAIKSKAASQAAKEKSNGNATFAWDDLWYKKRLSDAGDQYLLLFWHDWDKKSDRLEWAAIKNTPQAWHVYLSKDTTLRSPGNGSQIKFRTVYTNKNKNIDIDIHNPDNTGGYTSNDILFGFGW